MDVRLSRWLLAVAAVVTVVGLIWLNGRQTPAEESAPTDSQEQPAEVVMPNRPGNPTAHAPTEAAEAEGLEAPSAPALNAPRQAIVTEEEGPPAVDRPSTFNVRGKITSGGPLSDAVVFVERETGGTGERLPSESMAVEEEGTFGPIEIELGESSRFWFRLEGGGLTVEERVFDAPAPGSTLVVEFTGDPGETMWFFVYDEVTEEPLTDAEAVVLWEEDTRRVEAGGESRPNGYIKVEGCRAGSVRCLVKAPGYAASEWKTAIPPPEPETIPVGLEPAVTLTGRVVSAGAPVSDFALSFRRAGSPSHLRTVEFRNRADGKFELDVRVGPLEITASSGGSGQSPVARLEVIAGPMEEVLLGLDGTCQARGRVVDQETGAALQGARVQPFATIDGQPDHPIGTAASVDDDGFFEIEGVSPRGTPYSVSAPGYSSVTNVAVGVPDDVAELGTIALIPSQPLTIRLVSREAPDFTAFLLRTTRASLPTTHFDEQGVVSYPNADIGPIQLHIVRPDGSEVIVSTSLLPRETWELEVPVDGRCSLTIEVVPQLGEELPADIVVHAIAYEEPPHFFDFARFLEDGYGGFRLPCRPYSVRVSAADGTALLEEVIDFDGDDDVRLVAELGAATFTVRVVDLEGAPVDRAFVIVTSDDIPANQYRLTNASGRVQFLSNGNAATVLVAAAHDATGTLRDVPFSITGAPGEEIELVMDTTSSLEVRVMHGDSPVANVECSLVDPTTNYGLGDIVRTTDEAGYARWEKVGKGDYDVIGAKIGFQPFRQRVRTDTSEAEVVQMLLDDQGN